MLDAFFTTEIYKGVLKLPTLAGATTEYAQRVTGALLASGRLPTESQVLDVFLQIETSRTQHMFGATSIFPPPSTLKADTVKLAKSALTDLCKRKGLSE